MRYTPIERNLQGEFFLNQRRIIDGDKIELEWPDGQTVITTIKIIHNEFRVVGIIHGIKCWIVLDFGIRKGEVKAKWENDGYA
jgi:hypothetical protein